MLPGDFNAKSGFRRSAKVFAPQPFSLFIGAELTKFSELGIEIRLQVRDDLR